MTRIVIDGLPIHDVGALADRYGDPSARGLMASSPTHPDPDASRMSGHGVEPNAGMTFATGGGDRDGIRTRRADDPADPYGPEGEEVGDNRDAGAAQVLRERYQTLPDGQPSGRIIVED